MTGARPLSSHRILVVDDDDAVARTTARVLAHLGHETITTPSGAEALRLVGEREIHLVISDVNMPGLDGIDLLRELRARDFDVPVVLLTGAPTEDGAARALEHGAASYLTKPVDVAELALAVDDAARARSLARAPDRLGRPPTSGDG